MTAIHAAAMRAARIIVLMMAAAAAALALSATAAASLAPPSASPSLRSFPDLHPHRDWKLAERPHPHQRHCFQLALRHDASLLAELQERLWNVSDPAHATYGSHLSKRELATLIGDRMASSRDSIRRWLADSPLAPVDHVDAHMHDGDEDANSGDTEQHEWMHEWPDGTGGATAGPGPSHVRVSGSGDWLRVCSSVRQIELLFNTQLHVYAHPDHATASTMTPRSHRSPGDGGAGVAHVEWGNSAGRGIRASTALTLPENISPLLDFVGGINTPIHRAEPTPAVAAAAGKATAAGGKNVHMHAAQTVAASSSGSDHLVQSETEDELCAIDGAFIEYLPPQLLTKTAAKRQQSSPLVPRVLEATGGNEQVYVRWQMACTSHDDSLPSDCARAIQTFNFVLQPMHSDARLRARSLPVIAASLPLSLAQCHSDRVRHTPSNKKVKASDSQTFGGGADGADPAEGFTASTCEAAFPIRNYIGYWLSVQAELAPGAISYSSRRSSSASSAPLSSVNSCVRGPVFGREMASSSFLQRLYSIPSSMRALRHVNNSIAIVEFTEQYFNHKDLDTYLDAMANNDVPQQLDTASAHAPSTASAAPGVAAASTNAAPPIRRTRSPPKVVGFNNDTEALLTGDEAQLDLQVVGGLLGGDPLGDADWPTVADLVESHDAPSSSDVLSRIWMWNVAGRESPNPEEPFLRWLLAVQELRAPPLVHSVSYGDLEEQLPLFYMQRINVEFLKLGLRGVTLVFPSGDKGVASDFEPEEEACKRSRPEFPVSSPYVLSVGATQLSAGASSRALCSRVYANSPMCSSFSSRSVESVCAADTGGEITTGGGFSNIWPAPPFQRPHVHAYLHHHRHLLPTQADFFNHGGRGYPDVSGYGTAYVTINDGEIVPAAGTSASVPLVAAIIAMRQRQQQPTAGTGAQHCHAHPGDASVNDVRLSSSLPPLGFVTPLLYSLHRTHPHAFRDITNGNNRCRLQDQTCCKRGFPATEGWDAVSGLGVLRVDVMAQLIADGYPFAERGGRMRIDPSAAVEKPARPLANPHTSLTSIQLKQSAGSGASLPLHSASDARTGVAVLPLLLAALLLLLLVALTLRGCCGANRNHGCASASVSLSSVASEQGARAEAQPFAYQAACALP